MDTSYIRIRQPQPNGFLEGASNMIDVFANIRRQRQEDQKKRAQTISRFAEELDFENSISSANKAEQINIYKALNDELNAIIKNGVSRKGGLGEVDNQKAMMLMKEANMRMQEIGQNEKRYWKMRDDINKNISEYNPSDIIEFDRNYIENGKINEIKMRPIPFDVWEKQFDTNDYKAYYPVNNKDGSTVIMGKKYANDDERLMTYADNVTRNPRRYDDLVNKFNAFAATNPKEAQKYIIDNQGMSQAETMQKAILRFGMDTEGQKFNRDVAVQYIKKPAESSTKTNTVIEGIKQQDGSTKYIIGGKGAMFSNKVLTVDDELVDLINAKVAEVKIDPNSDYGGTITLMGTVEEPVLSSDGEETGKYVKKTKTYTVPYNKYNSFIKNNFKLKGIESMEGMRTKPQFN